MESATIASYRSDWNAFRSWAEEHGHTPLPATAQAVAEYLTVIESKYTMATLRRKVSAIAHFHEEAGYLSPTSDPFVVLVVQGIADERSGDPRRTAEPFHLDELLPDDVVQMVRSLGAELIGQRDRALLLTIAGTRLRRADVARLQVGHFHLGDYPVEVELPDEKRVRVLRAREEDLDLGLAVRAWFEAAGLTDGPAFRSVDRHGRVSDAALSDRSITLAVKRAAERAGVDPAAHSADTVRGLDGS